MLADIIGTLWIILGAFWLIKPTSLQKRLKRKINRKIRWIVLGFILIFALSILGAVLKAEGLLLKLAGIIGIIIAIRAVLLLTSKTSGKLLDKLADRPLVYFRIGGLLILIIGIILVVS